MNKPTRIIPQKALSAQARSSDPQMSVWVSANAGSGKTHVLTERVIRLLLEGTEPSRILCLTYTKAAAAVMQTRIFSRLSQWTRLNDEELGEALYALEHRHGDKKRLAQARRLFARALETPGGLKIQTIHAFCEALLHQFPVEANIAGHFEMIDDMEQSVLIGNARRMLLETAYRREDSDLAAAFDLILMRVGETGLDRLLSEAIANRENLKDALQRWRKEGAALFHRLFDVPLAETEETLSQKLKDCALFSSEALAQLMATGGVKTAEFVEPLKVLSQESDWRQFKNLVSTAYLTKQGQPASSRNIITKAVKEAWPAATDIFLEKQNGAVIILDQLRALQLIDLNMAAYHMINALNGRYEEQKRARGYLDFDDLIHRTLALLKRKGAGQWVQYKLDRGIDHILVDEAQDTSPAQWEIVRLLSAEFFSGLGARDIERTIFAVGDEKQSIYSFQGAVPEDFARNGNEVRQHAVMAGKHFERVRLDFSFRSTKDVLSAVDAVFATPENYNGLSAENEPTVHDAIRKNEPGEVDIWEALTPEDVEEPEDWRKPVDHLAAPAVRLAAQIAQTIHNWLDKGEVIAGQKRQIRPRDIMVLVRKRDQFVHALSRELKNCGVAVAGADRLKLTDHIAVRDLVALGAFVLQPRDDLSLAATLKSPLFGLDEDRLFSLAAGREGTLVSSLEKGAKTDEHLATIYERLRHYRAIADITPVYEFYSRILSEDGGRRKILARLGAEASDVLDAFMDYTLAIQKTGLPGLQAFLETLREAEPEIKREMDQTRDEVRIMTVHAAKGLEAAVVFLVDSGSQIWNANHEPKLIAVKDPAPEKPLQKGKNDSAILIWQPTKNTRSQCCDNALDALKERAKQEYRRLLYVGMTRAEDRLIVCGYKGRKQTSGTWLDLVADALMPLARTVEVAPADGVIAHRYQVSAPLLPLSGEEKPVESGVPIPPPPTYLFEKAPPENGLPRPLAPSGAALLIEDAPNIDPALMIVSPILEAGQTERSTFAIERGNIIHALLQYLPDIAPDKRPDLARGFIERQAGHWQKEDRDDALASVFAIIENEALRTLFAPDSRAETALMGVIDIGGINRSVSGQIDRLSVCNDVVVFADFKTGRVPQNIDEIPDAYILQMALYSRLLQQLYPAHAINSLLIYTQGPKLFALEKQLLAEMIGKLGKSKTHM